MNWDDKLSVHVSNFDKQHHRLIELFNSFCDSIHNKEGKEKVLLVIKGLKDYTVYHFTDEERVMKLHHYPGFDSHKKDHDAFIKHVLDFEERYKAGKLLLSIEIINFIKDWITKHIMDVDKQYSKFLNEKGVK